MRVRFHRRGLLVLFGHPHVALWFLGPVWVKDFHVDRDRVLSKVEKFSCFPQVKEPYVDTFAALGLFADRNPAGEGEIDRLGAVEAVVETGVVRARHRHDELARLLDNAMERNARVVQDIWTEQGGLVPQKLGALLELCCKDALGHFFEFFAVFEK